MSKEKPDWFDLNNYELARYIDPGYWAWQLQVRMHILSNPNSLASKTAFEKIKSNGVSGIDWSYPVYNSKFSQGIAFPSTSILKANSTIRLIEEIKQNQLSDGFITENVEVLDFEGFLDYFNKIDDDLLYSLDQKDKMWHGSDKQLESSEIELINSTSNLFHNISETNGKVLIELDISAPNETIKSNFNTILKALKENKNNMSVGAGALSIRNWPTKANKYVDDGILPYLDMLINKEIYNEIYSSKELEMFILKETKHVTTPIDKIKKTTRPNALKLIKLNEIKALQSFYSTKTTLFWKNYTEKNHV